MKSLILAVDPGKLSGIALVDRQEPRVVWSDELDFFDCVDRVNATLYEHASDIVVVVEAFIITPQTGKNSQAGWSLEAIGAIRWLTHRYGAGEMLLQKPAEALSFVDNDRLKAFGLWHVGGHGHAKDALRHALLYLIKTSHGQDARLLGTASSS